MNDNTFSPADKSYNKKEKTIGYFATPSGTLLEYNPKNDEITTVSKDIPSDSKDPNRQNRINPIENPAAKSLVTSIIDWIRNIF